MNDPKLPTQRLLFECDGPRWNTLPSEPRHPLVEILSQLLLDALLRYDDESITSKTTTEDDHD